MSFVLVTTPFSPIEQVRVPLTIEKDDHELPDIQITKKDIAHAAGMVGHGLEALALGAFVGRFIGALLL